MVPNFHRCHWARWNDAVREAGFEPNALQGPFHEELLLEKLALATRELGRFPTRPELRLRARNDGDFPDPKTFERFGTKADLAARLVTHCEVRGYEDVANLAGAELRRAPAQEKALQLPEFGFVYLLKVGRYYKIGRSNAVGRRERELAIQLSERATRVHSIKTDDPVGIETYWHRRFEEKRGNGEWFKLSADDVSAFRRRRFM